MRYGRSYDVWLFLRHNNGKTQRNSHSTSRKEMIQRMYDVAIIGGGICGCSLLYELSKYNLKVVLIEKENDVALGTTKANSAIVHAGYDPENGTAMAKYNVEGNRMIKQLCEQLDVPYKQIGSLVIALSEKQLEALKVLKQRGDKNGVPDLKLLNHEETLALEPNLNPEVKGALLAPTAGVVSPWELAIALAETAIKNGAEVLLRSEVTEIKKGNNVFHISMGDKMIQSRFVVNAAGVLADKVSSLAEKVSSFTISPSKGEYYLLDKNQGNIVSHVIFQCPTELGKGVLVSPTVHGNLIVGPNAEEGEVGHIGTTADGLDYVRKLSVLSVPGISFRDSIRNFAGLRANSDQDDFIVGESKTQKGFFHIAGIKSPGLTAAPAIAADMVRMLEDTGLELTPRDYFVNTRKVYRFRHMDATEREQIIRQNPLYGRIVCRCETVTEGEIVDALHRPLPPVSVDGVKRRCGCGMGRCQGGFCGPRVQEIIARELGLPMEQIPLDRDGMDIITSTTKQ